jgi:hypothetical protein
MPIEYDKFDRLTLACPVPMFVWFSNVLPVQSQHRQDSSDQDWQSQDLAEHHPIDMVIDKYYR